jgi:hypothetical protein
MASRACGSVLRQSRRNGGEARLRVSAPPFDALAVLTGYGPAMLQIAKLVRAKRRLFFDARFPEVYPEYPPAYDNTGHVDRSWHTARLLDPELPRPVELVLPALAAPPAPRAANEGPAAWCRARRSCAGPWARDADAPIKRPAAPPGLPRLGRHRRPQRRPRARRAVAAGAELRTFQPRRLARFRELARGTALTLVSTTLRSRWHPGDGLPRPTQPQLVVMSEQPSVAAIRIEALGAVHCDEKGCVRPECLHQAVAVWHGLRTAPRLDEVPSGCPLRAAPPERLLAVTVHENPRRQA